MNMYDILTAYSPEPAELKSIDIFKISLSAPEILIKYIFFFLTYLQLRNFFLKSKGFCYLKNLKI